MSLLPEPLEVPSQPVAFLLQGTHQTPGGRLVKPSINSPRESQQNHRLPVAKPREESSFFLTVTDFGGRIMRTPENKAQRVFAAVLHGTRNGERLYCTVVG